MPLVLDGLYTTHEAADVFRVSPKTLRNWASNGVFSPEESWRENRTRRVFNGAGIRRVLAERRAEGNKLGPLFAGRTRSRKPNSVPEFGEHGPGEGIE
jgi:hypothetical protein